MILTRFASNLVFRANSYILTASVVIAAKKSAIGRMMMPRSHLTCNAWVEGEDENGVGDEINGPSKAARGVAWRGVAWRGVAWRGVAWRGVAWRGVAWRSVAWRGETRHFVAVMSVLLHSGHLWVERKNIVSVRQICFRSILNVSFKTHRSW